MLYEQMEEKLVQLTHKDTDYQELKKQFEKSECNYLAILNRLSPEEKQVLEDYICKSEELEYRRTFLAYCLGLSGGNLI